jgi:metal-sulfur cluster biosynthetic enzyme
MPDRRSALASAVPVVGAAALICVAGFLLTALPWLLRRGPARSSSAAPAGVWAALAGVMDPELGAGVVDLGLVREVLTRAGGEVEVRILLTSPVCPYQDFLASEIRRVVESVPGVRAARVTVDRETAWTPELASPELRRRLGSTVSGSP